MIWLVLSMPLLIWIWWGVAFTIIDFTLHLAEKEESPMNTELAKIIRFRPLATPARMNLLSTFDAERNLLTIDPDNYQLLSPNWQTHVTFSDLPMTVVTSEGNFIAA